jgi:septal ring factor EnvC (AmiA/AmiB activator)
MSRFPLILFVVALAGAVISGVLYFRAENSRQTLAVQLADATDHSRKLASDLAAANETNTGLQARMDASAKELSASLEKLSAAELRAMALEHDLTKAKSTLSIYEQNSRALADEVASLKADLADTRASYASPEAVTAYKNTIAELERQLANSRNGAAAPTAAGASTAVFASRPGRATVLTVGPSNAFVVLNFGSARGAQVGQRLNVSQGTEVVATVLISDVRTNFSVAQVQSDTLRGVLQKGDLALLIR